MRSHIKSKQGNLSLSINAIVVLIMAITMLGLGLGFMKNMMGNTMSKFGDVSEELEAEMINELKDSSDRLTFKGEDVKFKQGETKSMYFAVKNDGAATDAETFNINATCTGKMGTGNPTTITLSTFKTVSLKGNEIKVSKMNIKIPATQVVDTYSCSLEIKKGTTAYEKKDFYITVE